MPGKKIVKENCKSTAAPLAPRVRLIAVLLLFDNGVFVAYVNGYRYGDMQPNLAAGFVVIYIIVSYVYLMYVVYVLC